jgi:hypothetical protein
MAMEKRLQWRVLIGKSLNPIGKLPIAMFVSQ